MNLIDRDKLIEAIDIAMPWCDSEWDAGMEECKQIAREQPTVNEWIPVSERLPEEPKVDYESSDEMLCAVYQGRNIYYELCRYNFDEKIWRNEECIPRNVVAWKPIEPYEVNND